VTSTPGDPAARPRSAWDDNRQRAEETVDRAVERTVERVRRLIARAREEGEDLWAEAQSERRRGAP
jgi:hypothetical protein